jgi:hypothetical protein
MLLRDCGPILSHGCGIYRLAPLPNRRAPCSGESRHSFLVSIVSVAVEETVVAALKVLALNDVTTAEHHRLERHRLWRCGFHALIMLSMAYLLVTKTVARSSSLTGPPSAARVRVSHPTELTVWVAG